MNERKRVIPSLQAMALRKMDPRVIASLRSPIKTEGLNEIATRIQRNYTRMPYNTYRKGKKMTTAAIKRQLIRDADSTQVDTYLTYLKNIIKEYVNTEVRNGNIENITGCKNVAENKYLFKNLERDLVVGLYNRIYGLSEDEEDRLYRARGINNKSKKKKKKKKHKTKNKKNKK
tara:strand:- start:9565 stop:10086 length:522 start_codon:yes stop_codon:yes gene_type:complete